MVLEDELLGPTAMCWTVTGKCSSSGEELHKLKLQLIMDRSEMELQKGYKSSEDNLSVFL